MLYTFIWKSSVNRVKKDIMQKEYQEGGLKMILCMRVFHFENTNLKCVEEKKKQIH